MAREKRARILAVTKALIFPTVGYLGLLVALLMLSTILDYQMSEQSLNGFVSASFSSRAEETKAPNPNFHAGKKQFSTRNLFYVCITLSTIIALVCLASPGYLETDKDGKNSVVLKDSSNFSKRLLDTLHGKHSIFKNSYRGWLHIQAVFATQSIGLILVFSVLVFATLCNWLVGTKISVHSIVSGSVEMKMLQALPVTFLSVWYLVYQRLLSDFKDKWAYCAGNYNKVLENELNGKSEMNVLRIALAIDILTLDLWARRTFAREFHTTLIHAIEACYSEELAIEAKSRLSNRMMSEQEAQAILEELLFKARVPKGNEKLSLVAT